MEGTSIVIITLIVFAAVFGIGFLIQKAPSRIVKYVNWMVFSLAIISGLASYSSGEAVYRYTFFISLIAYFLTIRYKTE